MNKSFDASFSPVDVKPGVPLYKHIEEQILCLIADGYWETGSMLPNERNLCVQFKVSIGTLRKAVDQLVNNGVLTRQQGRGTFVATHSRNRYLFSFFHVKACGKYKEFPAAKLLEIVKVRAPKEIAKLFPLPQKATMFRITNLLSLDGKPTIVDVIYIPCNIFRHLDADTLVNRRGTIYQLYQEKYQISVIRTDESVRAISADAITAERLNITLNSPILHVTRIARTFAHRVVEIRYSSVNTQQSEYTARHFG